MKLLLSLTLFALLSLSASAVQAQYSPAPPPSAVQQDDPQTCELRLKDLIEEYLDGEDHDFSKTLEQLDADDSDVEAIGDAIEDEFDVSLTDGDWNVIETRSANEIVAMLRSKRVCD